MHCVGGDLTPPASLEIRRRKFNHSWAMKLLGKSISKICWPHFVVPFYDCDCDINACLGLLVEIHTCINIYDRQELAGAVKVKGATESNEFSRTHSSWRIGNGRHLLAFIAVAFTNNNTNPVPRISGMLRIPILESESDDRHHHII